MLAISAALLGTTFFHGKFFKISRASFRIPQLTAANFPHIAITYLRSPEPNHNMQYLSLVTAIDTHSLSTKQNGISNEINIFNIPPITLELEWQSHTSRCKITMSTYSKLIFYSCLNPTKICCTGICLLITGWYQIITHHSKKRKNFVETGKIPWLSLKFHIAENCSPYTLPCLSCLAVHMESME